MMVWLWNIFVYQGPVRRTYLFFGRANHCWPWTHNHILVQRMQNHSPSAFPFKTCLFCVTVTSKTPRDAFGLRILICEARTKFQTSVERPVELTMLIHPCQKPRDIRHNMQNNQQKIMKPMAWNVFLHLSVGGFYPWFTPICPGICLAMPYLNGEGRMTTLEVIFPGAMLVYRSVCLQFTVQK